VPFVNRPYRPGSTVSSVRSSVIVCAAVSSARMRVSATRSAGVTTRRATRVESTASTATTPASAALRTVSAALTPATSAGEAPLPAARLGLVIDPSL
jgi:hypothetical protein